MPTHSIEAPEPALSPEAMIARAREMRPVLRERQLECERAGRILPATHKQFVEAGFYRIVQPRRFGGYESDLPTFHRVMIEIARGCPSSGWVLALTAGHPLILARFDERAQLEAYGADGEFRAPASGAPVLIHPASGGYTVKGFWDYASGCDVGTHFIGPAILRAPGEPAHHVLLLLYPRDYQIVDNWQVFAMQGTGSKRIAIENEIFVPDYRTAQGGLGQDPPAQSSRIEGVENPLYHGRITSFLIGEAAAVVVGTARGAIDIYEEILAIKPTSFPRSSCAAKTMSTRSISAARTRWWKPRRRRCSNSAMTTRGCAPAECAMRPHSATSRSARSSCGFSNASTCAGMRSTCFSPPAVPAMRASTRCSGGIFVTSP